MIGFAHVDRDEPEPGVGGSRSFRPHRAIGPWGTAARALVDHLEAVAKRSRRLDQ